MPSIWVSDEDYETLIDIKANLEKHLKKPASFSDVVSYLVIKKQKLGGKSRKEVKKTRDIRAKALTAAISAFMLISLISVFQAGTASAQDGTILTVTGDGAGGFTLAEMDQHFSTDIIDASSGDTILSGSVTLGNFENGSGNDVWYEVGLVSDATYLGYSRLHNKGVYMIALWTPNYYKVHMQNVPGYENPPAVGNYLGNGENYVDLWGDNGLCYFKVPSASFQYEIKYHDVTADNGKFDLRINENGTWSGWKHWEYAENDEQVQYGWTAQQAVDYSYADDDDLTSARIVSQIFVCSTTTETFTATYSDIEINGTPYELLPRVLNTDTGKGYAGIQVAIDNAAPGDSIEVAAGTYAEAITIGTDNLVLQSESELGAIIRSPTTPANFGAAIYISANGVTIDGFEIDGTTVCKNGILGWETSNLTIKNNKIHGAVNAWDGCGILLFSWGNSGTVYNNLIEGNEVYDTGRMGIMVMDYGGAQQTYTVTSGNTITGNIVHDVWKVAWGDHGGGIQINVAKNCSITNNEVYDVRNGQRGIYMFGSATGNTISYNTLRDNPIGIQLWISGEGGTTIDWGDDTPASPQIRYNNIYNNGTGAISSNIAGTPMVMDAALNWWGDPTGPGGVGLGTGDNVSVNVNYASWLPRPLPTISDISVSGVTTTSAKITWTTALPANSRVEYGPTIAYGLTSSIPDLTTSHSLGLTGLTPSTTYHFMVRSEDAYGHMDNSGDLTFITASPPPPATLTVGTTPIKANVYVDGSLWGVALRTRSLAAGTYTISFGDVLGYLTPAPEIVTLAAGETRTVTGVYAEIPPENIENQSPTYDISSVTPEENTTILVENTVLTEITIQVENAAENVKITVQEVTEGAAGIAIGAPGVTYKYLNIVAENITDAQIESVVIRFKVEKSWIILNDIDIATITLNHYDPLTDEWTSLPTTYLSEDDTYVYFSAISPGLSIFGVSGSTTIPANFELSSLVITPSEVSAGETVTISVVVNNAGGRTGSTTVTLEINGAAVDTRSVTLDAGKSTTVTFTVSEDVAGTYTVNVADLTGSFVVTALPAPPIVPLAVSIIIIVLAIGIIMWRWRIR